MKKEQVPPYVARIRKHGLPGMGRGCIDDTDTRITVQVPRGWSPKKSRQVALLERDDDPFCRAWINEKGLITCQYYSRTDLRCGISVRLWLHDQYVRYYNIDPEDICDDDLRLARVDGARSREKESRENSLWVQIANDVVI